MPDRSPSEMQPKPRRRRKAPPLGLWVVVVVLLLGAAYVAVLDNASPHVSGRALTLSTFVDMVNKGQIVDATVLDYDSYVVGDYRLQAGKTAAYNTPYIKNDNSG